MNNVKILPDVTEDGFFLQEITDGIFKGIVFKLGEVTVVEEGDEAKLSYHYNVIEGEVSTENKKALDNFIGDYLIKLLEEQLDKGELVYAGGTDEVK